MTTATEKWSGRRAFILATVGSAVGLFVTVPLAFAGMPFGTIAAITFFVLLFVAALASAISMLEIGAEIVIRRLGWSRLRASLSLSAGCFLLGLGSVFSFNLWAGWYPLSAIDRFRASTVFDLLDYGTSNLLLPAAGLALSLFAGWAVPHDALAAELGLGPRQSAVLRAALRYLVPAGIVGASLAPFVRA